VDGAAGDDDLPSSLAQPKSGICITLLVERLQYGGGWLYACDLRARGSDVSAIIFVSLVIDPRQRHARIGAAQRQVRAWMVVRGSGDVSQPRPERRRRFVVGRRGHYPGPPPDAKARRCRACG